MSTVQLQTIQLSSKRIIPPNKNDNHIRSLVCETKKEYKVVPDPENPDFDMAINTGTSRHTYWKW